VCNTAPTAHAVEYTFVVPCEAPGLAACRLLHWRSVVCPVTEQERGGGSSGSGAASGGGGGGANSRGALLAALNKARRGTLASPVTDLYVVGPVDSESPHLVPLLVAGYDPNIPVNNHWPLFVSI
jgi:hypothetical protein